MTPTRTTSAPRAGKIVSCDLAASSSLKVSGDTLKSLRQKVNLARGEPFPPSLLKQLDEQTLAGLEAVDQAVHAQGLAGVSFADWAVLGVPRFLGRMALAGCLQRFAEEGAWGMSPHLIPHRTLHSLSGTLSLALKVHGPNFGMDGGPGGLSGAVLGAAALLAGGQTPGVWLVLTGWDPEPLPDRPAAPGRNGAPHPTPVCLAAALALVPAGSGRSGRLRVLPGDAGNEDHPAPAPLSLERLVDALGAGAGAGCTWRLDCGGTVRLERGGVGGQA